MGSGSSWLRFALRGGRTALVEAHVELPLLVQRPLHGPDGQVVLVLLTPAGALFDADNPRLDITCEPGTDVTLASASATKLNRCDRSHIGFSLEVSVSAGATFRYVPYELIPFPGNRYVQSIRVRLDADASAWLLEVIGPGPTAGPFAYTSLRFLTEVRRDRELLAREQFTLTPGMRPQLGGYSHYGGLMLLGASLDRAAAVAANDWLRCPPYGGVAAASCLPAGGIGLKMLGDSAQSIRETLLLAAGTPKWLTDLLPT